MKRKKVSVLLALFAVSFVFGPSVDAQLNLGKLKNKLEKKVKTEVKNGVKTEVKDRAKDQVVEQVKDQNAVSSLSTTGSAVTNSEKDGFDPYRKYNPSEAAKAADRFATDETVKPGFTKSIGQIHATYEHFDGIYNAADGIKPPYQPYYSESNRIFYFTNTGLDDNIHKLFGDMLMKSIAADSQNAYFVTDYVSIDENNPSVVVPKDEMFLNALTCQYIADPKSIFAFELYLKAEVYQNGFSSQRYLGMDDMTSGMIDKEHILASKYRDWCREREWAAQSLASEYIPYAEIIKLVDKYNKLYKEATDPTQKLLHFLTLNSLVNVHMKNAKGFSKSDDKYRLMTAMIDNTNKGELYMNAAGANAEPVSEPKGVGVSADIKKLAESVVGKFVSKGAKVEKIIYHESQWHSLKNPKWPYEVIAHSLKCAVVTNENGKRYIQEAVLTKDAKSSNAFMQAGTDAMKRPLK